MENTEFLTIKQLAERLGVSLAHAYRLVNAGEIPSVRLGKWQLRVSIAEYEKWKAKALGAGTLPARRAKKENA